MNRPLGLCCQTYHYTSYTDQNNAKNPTLSLQTERLTTGSTAGRQNQKQNVAKY